MAIEHFHNLKFKEKFLFDVCSGVFIIKSSLVTYSLRSNKAKFQISSEKSKTATSAVFTISHTLKKFWPRLAFFPVWPQGFPKIRFCFKTFFIWIFMPKIKLKIILEGQWTVSMPVTKCKISIKRWKFMIQNQRTWYTFWILKKKIIAWVKRKQALKVRVSTNNSWILPTITWILKFQPILSDSNIFDWIQTDFDPIQW